MWSKHLSFFGVQFSCEERKRSDTCQFVWKVILICSDDYYFTSLEAIKILCGDCELLVFNYLIFWWSDLLLYLFVVMVIFAVIFGWPFLSLHFWSPSPSPSPPPTSLPPLFCCHRICSSRLFICSSKANGLSWINFLHLPLLLHHHLQLHRLVSVTVSFYIFYFFCHHLSCWVKWFGPLWSDLHSSVCVMLGVSFGGKKVSLKSLCPRFFYFEAAQQQIPLPFPKRIKF